MSKLPLILILIALAPSATAQVFPGVTADRAEKAAKDAESGAQETGNGNGNADTAKPPEQPKDPAPEPPPEPAPSTEPTREQKVLEKEFKEAIGSVANERRTVVGLTKDIVAKAHTELREYAGALIEYHTEDWARSEASLGKFKPPQNSQSQGDEFDGILAELRGGRNLVEGYHSKLFTYFDPDFKSEKKLEDALKSAASFAKRASDALIQLAEGGRPPWNKSELVSAATDIKDFADQAKAPWLRCWKAWTKAKATPWDADAVWELIDSCWVYRRIEMNMHQRVLARWFIRAFPEHTRVKDGSASLALAWSLHRTYQYEEMELVLEKAQENFRGDGDAREHFGTQRQRMREQRRRTERGLLWIRNDRNG